MYATIYSEGNPLRANEIWQYVEIINIAASKYSWENVSSYDFQFRKWMAKNLLRNWGKTLPQIWNLELVDPVSRNGSGKMTKAKGSVNTDQICWKFNKGKCEFGKHCRFEHRCSYCGGTNHGYNFCRWRKNETAPPLQSKDSQTGKKEEKKQSRAASSRNETADQ